MRFWLGLAVGAVVGAGATWLGLEKPWRGAPQVAVAVVFDAGPVERTSPAKRQRRRHGGRRGGDDGGGGDPVEPQAPVLSAADRAIVRRGPAIALPNRSIDLGGGDDARPLSPGEINDVIQSASQPILDCIESSRRDAVLDGVVRIELLVSGDGQPSKVRVSAPRWLIEHGLAECASGAARGWRFPATGAPTVVDAPYHLDER